MSSRKHSTSPETTKTTTTTTLSPNDLLELRESFEIFDEEKTGRITIHNLKVMARALGFQVTRDEITKQAQDVIRRQRQRRRGGENEDDDDDNDESNSVDFAMICEIMGDRYAKRHPEQELRKAFELFDEDNTGGITLHNLRNIARELGEELSDDELRAMIDEFDRNQDGQISEEEFRFIMFREGRMKA